ncbi:uncharacterized protein LOC113347631 [Papaver somniferum]|uniref:uncharacterized protein LOC113347631 n=1 Tax=Papaver somniferum TaxID=3469 RepID=UPI000E705589|nr:uncharacterized protein LOC113347631 [Papaver somniferum]
MVIKIDMAKAFDRVNWDFLLQVLSQMGISSHWCNLIFQCICTTSMAVLVNGSPGKFFKPSRGLRQGDLLSPYLFLLCMEALYSKNTSPDIADNISNTLKVQRINPTDKYLGSPLFTTKSKIQDFKPCVDKLKFRFAGWKTTLSTARKMTMIQSVTSTTSIYHMNFFKIPKPICNDINAIQRDFFWNKEEYKSKGFYYFAWDAVNKPKELGGMGFKNMEIFNMAMLTKIAWRLVSEPNSLWSNTMKAFHYPNTEVIRLDTKPKVTDSWIWKGILERHSSSPTILLLEGGKWSEHTYLGRQMGHKPPRETSKTKPLPRESHIC